MTYEGPLADFSVLGEKGCHFWSRYLPHIYDSHFKATKLEVSPGLKTTLVISIQAPVRDWCLFATEEHLCVFYPYAVCGENRIILQGPAGIWLSVTWMLVYFPVYILLLWWAKVG